MKHSAWGSYRKNRLVLILFIVLWIPFGMVLTWSHKHFGLSDLAEWIAIVVWLILMAIQGARLALWPCPNCAASSVVIEYFFECEFSNI